MFVEGSGALLRFVAFNVTVNKYHIVGIVMLHPEVTASGRVGFDRTEVGVVAHDIRSFIVFLYKTAGVAEQEVSG